MGGLSPYPGVAGEVANFTGISSAYEPPLAPELHLDTVSTAPGALVDTVLDALRRRAIL